MEDKYTSYDQMRNSYSDGSRQTNDTPSEQLSDNVVEPDEYAQPVEQNGYPAGISQEKPGSVQSEPTTDSIPVSSVGQDDVILSLSQSLSLALHYQQALEEKLSSIIEWQKTQEERMHHLATQQETLIGRMERLGRDISSATPQGPIIMPDEIQKALSRVEKSSLDAIRESKNFQQTLYAKQNKELDGYRSLLSNTANANILTEIAHFRNAAEDIAQRLDDVQAKNLRIGVVEAIDELLEDHGVEIHQTLAGQRRSLRTCQTRKQIPTDNEALHGMVARSITPSFAIGNLILLKEIVDTYVYDASLKQRSDEDEERLTTRGQNDVIVPEENGSSENIVDTFEKAPDEIENDEVEKSDASTDIDQVVGSNPSTETVPDENN